MLNIIHIFLYLITALKSLKCFKPALFRLLIKNWYFASYESIIYKLILSISDCWFIRLNNGLVFPDPDPRIINILHIWSGIWGQFGLCSNHFCIILLYCCIYTTFTLIETFVDSSTFADSYNSAKFNWGSKVSYVLHFHLFTFIMIQNRVH